MKSLYLHNLESCKMVFPQILETITFILIDCVEGTFIANIVFFVIVQGQGFFFFLAE